MDPWDYGYLKILLEELQAGELLPRQDLLANQTTDIRVAESGSDLLLAYVPCNTKVCLNTDLSGWKIRVIDLAERFVACADFSVKEGKTIVEMHPFAQDALIVARKTNERERAGEFYGIVR